MKQLITLLFLSLLGLGLAAQQSPTIFTIVEETADGRWAVIEVTRYETKDSTFANESRTVRYYKDKKAVRDALDVLKASIENEDADIDKRVAANKERKEQLRQMKDNLNAPGKKTQAIPPNTSEIIIETPRKKPPN